MRGDSYLRCLLIQGAKAVIRTNADKDTPLANWIRKLEATRGRNKAAVALANKMARVGWAILKNDSHYQADYAA